VGIERKHTPGAKAPFCGWLGAKPEGLAYLEAVRAFRAKVHSHRDKNIALEIKTSLYMALYVCFSVMAD
jgi:hypothetical protein